LSNQHESSFEYNIMPVKRARIGQDLLNRRYHIGGLALEAGSKERKENHSVSNRGPALSSHNAIPLKACRQILRVGLGRPSQSWALALN
jgi:hypothetical protein